MAVRIVFLGPLADLAGRAEAMLAAPLDWAGLLAAMNDAVAEQLHEGRVKIACAGQVLAENTSLHAVDGDEVALLPPVSGG